MASDIERLTAILNSLVRSKEDQARLARMIAALDERYALSTKIAREPGLEDIIQQLFVRLVMAFKGMSGIQGKKILDIACGSNTSKAPSMIYINTPLGEQRIKIPSHSGYTAQFEPWFCRMLLELEADPVGVDIGDLDAEEFTHYKVDLGQKGALDFLPGHSFDALQDSRLFGSPEFTLQFPNMSDRLKIAAEIGRQEQRLLKIGGVVIHSDAQDLANPPG